MKEFLNALPGVIRRRIAWFGFAIATCYAAVVSPAETWELQPRGGVTQPVLVEVPNQPRAAVVLFAGGDGGVVFASNDVVSCRANFLLRSRAEFLKHGFKAPRTEFVAISGGKDEGKPCQAMAYHGCNGIEPEVVTAIAK